jgi:heme A synthase
MQNNNPWLHRLAIFVAVAALVAIILGAVVTSLERPIAGTQEVQMPPAAVSFEFWHHIAGGVAVVLMLGLAIGLAAAKSSKDLIRLGWIALVGGGLLDVAVGTRVPTQDFPELSGVLHALLAQVFFGCIVGIAVMTSESWKRGPEPIEDTWKPSLRSLAIAVPAVILLQTTLGASYRYHALGVLWHIMNAMIVLLLNLCVAVFLVRQFPQHPTLRPAAIALGVITGIQVMLGFTTFMMLILFPETSLAVVITSVLHVATGALTFGAGLALAILIRYNIRDVTS